jgi:hypothetical protein
VRAHGEGHGGPKVTALALAVDALATFRLTKLVVDDQLTAEARDAVIEAAYESAGRAREMRHLHPEVAESRMPSVWADCVVPNDDDPPKLAFLVTCPWCAGMWVALGVTALRSIAPRLWEPLARALALSAVAGLVSESIE